MSEKSENDKLDQLLKDRFIKETNLIEKSVLSKTNDEKDFAISEEQKKHSYEKLMTRLKAEGVYREDEDTSADMDKDADAAFLPQSEKVIPMPNADEQKKKRAFPWHKVRKVAGYVIVVAISVFAVNMTSEANRRNFIKSVEYFTGKDTRIYVGNVDGEVEEEDGNELLAKEKIEEVLGIDVPIFVYYPENFYFDSYDILDELDSACIRYKYNNNLLTLYISDEEKGSGGSGVAIYNYSGEIVNLKNKLIKSAMILEDTDKDGDKTSRIQWIKNDVIYQLSGKIERAELIKLVENIKY